MKEIQLQQREKLTIDKIVMNENPNIMSVEEQMAAKGGFVITIAAIVKGAIIATKKISAATVTAAKTSAAATAKIYSQINAFGKAHGGALTVLGCGAGLASLGISLHTCSYNSGGGSDSDNYADDCSEYECDYLGG